jgi:hypothetical protein
VAGAVAEHDPALIVDDGNGTAGGPQARQHGLLEGEHPHVRAGHADEPFPGQHRFAAAVATIPVVVMVGYLAAVRRTGAMESL